MLNRDIENRVKSFIGKYPVISITGPRQSGKTTLVKKLFPDYKYINFEDVEKRSFAENDPKGFIYTFGNNVIFDEIQYVPDLFSFIQLRVDEDSESNFVITGSQNFLLLEKISQSLAGRVALFNLLPFSINELANTKYESENYTNLIFTGGYPRIYDKNLQPLEWYNNYITTYLERDVRQITNVGNLSAFQKFIKLCAGRIGQLINFSGIANELSVSYHTIQNWLSILEASFIVFRLQPYYKNFNKRLVKSPKLYFYDTGLACRLLGLQTSNQLDTFYLKGELFENFIISDLLKYKFNFSYDFSLYFWRNNQGKEIDCVIDMGMFEKIVEIKSGLTIHNEFFNNLVYWNKISETKITNNFIIYGGKEIQKRTTGTVVGWNKISEVLK